MKSFKKVLGLAVALSLTLGLLGPISSVLALGTAESLGTADGFAVLSGSGVVDTNPSSVIGDVGAQPITGAAIAIPSTEVTGTIYSNDGAGTGDIINVGLLTTAKTDSGTAFTNGNLQPTDTLVVGTDLSTFDIDAGGAILPGTYTPGVYQDDGAPVSLAITAGNTIVLDGLGDPNAVFIFKSASTFTMGVGSTISLINQAQACNVFWLVGTSASFNTSTVVGNVLATASITDAGGSTVNGRLLADVDDSGIGAVTLNNTTVTRADCIVPPSSGNSANGYINVVKNVINDNGGTKVVADFPLLVNGQFIASGVTNIFGASTSQTFNYTVTETQNAGYTQSFSGDCDANGVVRLDPDETLFCIITNNDIGSPTPVAPVPPLIEVVKVPNPLALPGGPGNVQYTYTLRNIGTVPASNITMVGDTCSPIVLISGDTDNDAVLDLNETWVHTCSTNLTETHTNTVVATGWANGISAVDIASATVVVGASTLPPLIHITKTPNKFTLPAGGGMVTYTKKVTNPGAIPLSNVQVSDDKCSVVKYISGDTDNDSMLDTSETWTYTCSSNLTKTTTNTAVATGVGNGQVVRDFALATVTVANAVPALPNTGAAPTDMNVVRSILVATGLLLIVSASVIAYRRKQAL